MDRENFDRLLLDHLWAAQRFAIRLTGDANCAEDLLHDAIVRALSGWESFRGEARFTTWLFQIIVNCFRDRVGRRVAERMDSPMRPVHRPPPPDALEGEDTGRMVAQRVSNLPPRQREVLVLVAFERMSITEVAEVLSMNETNVRVTLTHARQRLKQELAGYLAKY